MSGNTVREIQLELSFSFFRYNRDWRYHKEERVWITRAIGTEPEQKTNTYEKGTYFFFDVQNWRKSMKPFYLEYDKLEERPHLPPEALQKPQMHPQQLQSGSNVMFQRDVV